MAGNFTRRTLLATTAAAGLAACGRKRAPRYSGWLFIASAGDRGIAVADLAEFRRVTTIPLPQTPGQIVPASARVFATCPEARLVCEIDPVRLAVANRANMPGRIVALRAAPGGASLIVATDHPAALHIVAASTLISATVALPDTPIAMDISDTLAVLSLANNWVARVSLTGDICSARPTSVFACRVVGLRPDGKSILVGAEGQNQIVTLDAGSGALLARLPIAFAPTRFCFSADNGGQMFVSGTGDDQIAIVSPYQNEVDQTLVAAHKPYGMTVAVIEERNLLCVTNSGSADLTIFDIDTRGLASSIHIGGNPGEVLDHARRRIRAGG